MKNKYTSIRTYWIVAAIGSVFVIWFGARFGTAAQHGLWWVICNFSTIFTDPFAIESVKETTTYCTLFTLLYIGAVGYYMISAGQYRRGEEYGSSRWASPKKINKTYCNKQSPKDNLLLSKHVAIGNTIEDIYAHGLNTNVIAIGGSGAGKTRGYVIPNLLQATTSYIVLDPSGEILRATGNFLISKGYRLRSLNLCDFDQGDGYNPFLYLRNDDDVIRMVDNFWLATTEKGAVKGEQIWDNAAKDLMAAFSFYLYYEVNVADQNLSNVQKLGELMQSKDQVVEKLFDKLAEEKPSHIALKYYRGAMSGAEKTKQSVVFSLLARLGKFNLDSVRRMSSTTEDELGLFDIAEQKTVIFAITPVADASFNFFVSLLYTQLFDLLYEYGFQHGHLKVPLHFLMDEFANVTLPGNFEQRMATFRKYHIGASIILQDISQLQALYEKEWKSIVGNADTMIYLGGNEDSTHELISKKTGKETIKTNTFSVSKGRNGNFSKNEQQTGRELMTPDEVRKLKNKYCLLFIRGEPPVLDRKYNLMSHPNIGETTYKHGRPYTGKRKDTFSYVWESVSAEGWTKEEIEALPELDLKTGKLIYP